MSDIASQAISHGHALTGLEHSGDSDEQFRNKAENEFATLLVQLDKITKTLNNFAANSDSSLCEQVMAALEQRDSQLKVRTRILSAMR